MKSVQFSVNLAKVGSTCPLLSASVWTRCCMKTEIITLYQPNDSAPSVSAQHFIQPLYSGDNIMGRKELQLTEKY